MDIAWLRDPYKTDNSKVAFGSAVQWRLLGRTEGLWAALVCAVAVALPVLAGGLQRLDLLVYDAAARTPLGPGAPDIVIVGIDNASVAMLGAQPWPGDVHARLLEQLAAAGARTVVYTPALPEQTAGSGLDYIRQIRSLVSRSGEPLPATAADVDRVAVEAENALNAELRLVRAIRNAGNVLLESRHAGTAAGLAAAGTGHFHAEPESDGKVRNIPALRVGHASADISLALLAAQRSELGKPSAPGVRTLATHPGTGTPPDRAFDLRPRIFTGATHAAQPFALHSFRSVLSGNVPTEAFAHKTVLVGDYGTDAAPVWQTAHGRSVHPVEMLAHAIWSVQNDRLIQRPAWAHAAGLAGVVASLLAVAFALPKITTCVGAVVAGLALAGTVAAAQWSLQRYVGLWVPLLPAAAGLLAGTAALVVRRSTQIRPGLQASSAESAETDRMMGLALQGQGQLEMAFERLRKVPMSDALLDNLYHLGRDFERQHNPERAKAVYGLILRHDRDHRDVRTRYRHLRAELQRAGSPVQARETSANTDHESLGNLQSPGVAPAALGRYAIERELGKGSMGVVYLGFDSRIGRRVALKTMALEYDFEGAALAEARSRFFREAETAGRLQHPHIVTVFDAGEDQGFSYIAMELLPGLDLARACKPEALLPVPVVLSIAARVADALDYSHAHGVVHRDIKPANIMYDAATDAVKVMDFGIARITDANRTRTGLVLGTPSFMSPEQLSGRPVDGRSDLYALGVTLFQLLCGRLPLRGASLKELMQAIASTEPPDIRKLRPDIPDTVARIVAKSLRKPPGERHQTGRELAADLRHAASSLPQQGLVGGTRPVLYDAGRDATGDKMADYQATETQILAGHTVAPPPVRGAP